MLLIDVVAVAVPPVPAPLSAVVRKVGLKPTALAYEPPMMPLAWKLETLAALVIEVVAVAVPPLPT